MVFPFRIQRENNIMSHPKVSPQAKTESESNVDSKQKTPYDQLMHSLHNDPKWFEEVCLGRRIGLYKFRGELGSGNFSQVKLAVHQLTNGSLLISGGVPGQGDGFSIRHGVACTAPCSGYLKTEKFTRMPFDGTVHVLGKEKRITGEKRVAIKVVDKGKLDEKTVRMLNQEISTMETVYHPNLIRLYEVVETYSKLYLVMEFANGGELYDRVVTMGKLDEFYARQLFGQICSAVEHMHSRNIIHRDIKAENVFFYAPNRVKLGDFGLSAQLTDGPNQLLTTICGSPPSAAPELFCEKTYVGGPVDVWALGILLYFMVVGLRPFGGKTVMSLKKNIVSGIYQMPRHLSRECAYLIDAMLKQKPTERLTVSEILASDWLKGVPLPSACEVSQSFTLAPTITTHSSDGSEIQLSEIEQTARQRLSELGISSQLLASQSCHGSRSHVIGCYRIIVHRIQRQLGVFLDLDSYGQATDLHWPKPQNEIKVGEKKFLIGTFSQKKSSGNSSILSNCWRRRRRRRSSSDEECYAKESKDDADGITYGEDSCLEKEGRVSLFRHMQAQSAAVKGGEESPVPVVRSRTCAII